MVTSGFQIKRGDTLPSLIAGLTERDPDSLDPLARRPLDLTRVDEVYLYGLARNGKLSLGGGCSILPADPTDPIWAKYPRLTPYPWKVRYDWEETDTEVAALFDAEFELRYQGGGVQTVPGGGYFPITVEPDQG